MLGVSVEMRRLQRSPSWTWVSNPLLSHLISLWLSSRPATRWWLILCSKGSILPVCQLSVWRVFTVPQRVRCLPWLSLVLNFPPRIVQEIQARAGQLIHSLHSLALQPCPLEIFWFRPLLIDTFTTSTVFRLMRLRSWLLLHYFNLGLFVFCSSFVCVCMSRAFTVTTLQLFSKTQAIWAFH